MCIDISKYCDIVIYNTIKNTNGVPGNMYEKQRGGQRVKGDEDHWE
jgi:hypothetical protein